MASPSSLALEAEEDVGNMISCRQSDRFVVPVTKVSIGGCRSFVEEVKADRRSPGIMFQGEKTGYLHLLLICGLVVFVAAL
jgi:hypothetical protein